MVLSGALLKLPYTLLWHLAQLLGKTDKLVFYCPEMLDYTNLSRLIGFSAQGVVVTQDRILIEQLKAEGSCKVKRLPLFPRSVVMCRHATHKFPCNKIVKIGLRHGAYHFKRMTQADNYNQFDLYLFSSQADLKAAQDIGVRVGKAVGFPRLDQAFRNERFVAGARDLARNLGHDPAKPTLLFTATWDKSGMSAVGLWYKRLDELLPAYNVMVTLHPWISERFRRGIEANGQVRILSPLNYLEGIWMADVVIGDTSSALADCCALDKPIIRFKTPQARRSLDEIEQLLSRISLSISSFEELPAAIQRLLAEPELFREGRQQANAIMFDVLDGKASERAWQEISSLLKEKGIWDSSTDTATSPI